MDMELNLSEVNGCPVIAFQRLSAFEVPSYIVLCWEPEVREYRVMDMDHTGRVTAPFGSFDAQAATNNYARRILDAVYQGQNMIAPGISYEVRGGVK